MYAAAFRVLEILDRANGPISGEAISERLGISRSAVWKHVTELRTMGYEINASQKEGYLLKKDSDRLLPYEIYKHLRTSFIGRKMRYFERTPSTIWIARKLAEDGNPEDLHGMMVIAEEQTGGVGRLGRSWASPAGGIWVTLILTPNIPIEQLYMLTVAGSVAVVRVIRKLYDIGAVIKWPNDILIGDRKVGGFLLELSAESDVVHYCLLGMGIDVNVQITDFVPALHDTITSIANETGHNVDRAVMLAQFLKEFESRYNLIEAQEYDSLILEWKSLSCTLGNRVRINTLRKTF
jgi:BirA family transcriptional regulator, biotin operon repressor / biotin---[acetyl-CoA-carboxylase] ligase